MHRASLPQSLFPLVTCLVPLAAPPSADGSETARIDFARDVQPILVSRCVKCHGRETAEAGLRLTDPEHAMSPLDSGARAVVPARPSESELLRRVMSDDPDVRMPPEGDAVTSTEIDRLRRWIADGAVWPPHWAYRPLRQPSPPTVDDPAWTRWPSNRLDRFVLDRLLQQGLTPSPPADKATLLRRVYFDLIGLPPTEAERRAFLRDTSPDAYDRVVDRLLASPRFGERRARFWMDLVHFAESHGQDQDRPRPHAWPYRDYLIRSFNSDKPYARFAREQVAGDFLDPDNPDAIEATGFLAAGPWDESSLRDIREDSIDREIGKYVDRDDVVTTVMSTFVSTTVHCARCHDHKFDPITQEEYYGLQAVFAGIGKGDRTYDRDPRIARRRSRLQARIESLPALVESADPSLRTSELRDRVNAWENAWQPVELIEYRSGGGATLAAAPDGSLLASGKRPDKDVYSVVVRCRAPRVTGLRIEVLTDSSLPHQGPGRQDNGNFHLNEIEVWSTIDRKETSDKASGGSSSAPTWRPVSVDSARADFDQDGWTIAHALDGDPNTAWGIHPEVGKSHAAVLSFAIPPTAGESVTLRIRLHQIHGGGHLIGRVRFSATGNDDVPFDTGSTLPPEVAEILRIPPAERTDRQRDRVTAEYLGRKLRAEVAALPPQASVYCGTSRFEPDGSHRPSPQPLPVHVLLRGDVEKPTELAAAGALNLLAAPGPDGKLDVADDEGTRRAALARWITDPENSLTWRSIANRLWQLHFGQGIVATPNDFGHMGSPPTHPELLDWLAAELRDNGGRLKALDRLIVTSAAYRQSSDDRTECADVDSTNRLIWRMNRRRLDAESVRDSILRIAGTLDTEMGGPSVKQFIQSPGVHVTPKADYVNFDPEHPDNHRRSVYRFVLRTVPDPFMDAFDCPDASKLTARRTESVTPLQSLAMLNGPLVICQSRHVARRAEASAGEDVREQCVLALRWILGRDPESEEIRIVSRYARRHGLANACRYLFNSNEFMFVN